MKKYIKYAISLLAVVCLVGCSAGEKADDDKVIRIGASPSPHARILEFAREELREKGYILNIKEFSDYVLPNMALEKGELDANYFQHLPYLEQFNKDNQSNIVGVAPIHFEPLGVYSEKYTFTPFTLETINEGATIAVPNDPTNEARALQLLEKHGILKLKEGVGLKATKEDIVENPKNVQIKEIEAANLSRSLLDVDYAVINGNYALDGNVQDKVLVIEEQDSEGAKTFANIIAVKQGNEESKKIKALIEVLQSEKTRTFIQETFGHLVVPISE